MGRASAAAAWQRLDALDLLAGLLINGCVAGVDVPVQVRVRWSWSSVDGCAGCAVDSLGSIGVLSLRPRGPGLLWSAPGPRFYLCSYFTIRLPLIYCIRVLYGKISASERKRGRLECSPWRDRGEGERGPRRAMLTQGELAEKSGVGITSIVRIERDQLGTSPRVSTLRKLAAALDVDPRELLDD